MSLLYDLIYILCFNTQNSLFTAFHNLANAVYGDKLLSIRLLKNLGNAIVGLALGFCLLWPEMISCLSFLRLYLPRTSELYLLVNG